MKLQRENRDRENRENPMRRRAASRVRVLPISADGNCLYRSVIRSARAWNAWPSNVQLCKVHTRAMAALRRRRIVFPIIDMYDGTSDEMVQWLRYVAVAGMIEYDLFHFSETAADALVAQTLRMGIPADHVHISSIARMLGFDVAILQQAAQTQSRRATVVVPCKRMHAPLVRIRYMPPGGGGRDSVGHYDAIVPVPPHDGRPRPDLSR